MNRHHYTLVVTENSGREVEYRYRHQLPAFRDFRQMHQLIGREGRDVKAVRLIRDDGMFCDLP